MTARARPTPGKPGALFVFDKLPLAPRRFFWIDAPAGARRGGHAHRACQQLIIPLRGDVRLRLTWFARGRWRADDRRLSPHHAWLIPPLVWVDLEFKSDGAVAVLASDPYDAADYVRDKRTLRRLSR